MYHVGGFESEKKKCLSEYVADTQCLHPEQPKIKVNPYEIYKDNREVQEQGKNYSSSAQQSERQVNNFSIFKDETEVTGLMQNGSGTLLDPAQHKSRNDWLCIDNIQTSHNQRTENQIPELHEAAKENCPASYFRGENIVPDSGSDEPCCFHIHNCNCESTLYAQGVHCNHIKKMVDA
jgi:hypothetical protein